MNFEIIASTKPSYVVEKENLDNFCGKVGGVCYMPNSFEELMAETKENTDKRINRTMGSGHHSVFEHGYITMHLEGIPKLFAMVLNNEKVYVTSEKSGRYTTMKGNNIEEELYGKWISIFEKKIREKYPEKTKFMTDYRVKNLAKENARYFLSIKMPTTMVYTTSYRQLNYLCRWMQNELENTNSYYNYIFDAFTQFINYCKEINLLDERLMDDGKFRGLSFFNIGENRAEIYDTVYSTNYNISFIGLAQTQRHRTLNYEVNRIKTGEFYVPKILNKEEAEEWQSDLYKIKDHIPLGTLLSVNERGTVENFILKLKERLCACTQLEANLTSRQILEKYIMECNDPKIIEYLKQYAKGSRCTFPDFKCKSPCGFIDGIKGEREI